MNPGTILFVVIGVIGLMLYILKALRVSVKESFISEGSGELVTPLGEINSLLSTLGTPDFSIKNNVDNAIPLPDISKLQIPNLLQPEPTPSLSITAAVPPSTAIPAPSDLVKVEAPIIPKIPITEGMSQTASDVQGAAQKEIASKEAFITRKEFQDALDKKKVPNKKRMSQRRRRIVKKCPPMPDMTLYIRKDQIPCWGCVLK